MKYCSECGTQHDDGVMFCTKCGAKFDAVPETQDLQAAAMPAQQPPVQNINKKLVAIISGVAGLFVIAAIVVVALFSGGRDNGGEEATPVITETPAPTDTPEPSPTPKPTPKATIPPDWTAEQVEFKGITLTYPADRFSLLENKDDISFYGDFWMAVKYDNAVLYTEDIFQDADALDRLAYIYIDDLFDSSGYQGFWVPEYEITYEPIEVSGLKAVRAIYHVTDFPYNYLEVILFVHNYDLYVIQARDSLGAYDIRKVTQPIIDNMRFSDEVPMASDRPMPYSDTVQWLNSTFVLLTASNGGNNLLLGGFIPTETIMYQMRITLSNSWSITDRKSCDETIARMLESGHSAAFQEFIAEDPIFKLSPDKFQDALNDVMDEYDLYAQEYSNEIFAESGHVRLLIENFYESYRLHGDNAILAWDYCRFIQLYCMGYLAGYYTYTEALDFSLEIAKELQKTYSSWEEMYTDYLAGYNYWSMGDLSDPLSENSKRRQYMEELLNIEYEPLMLPPWDMELVADWRE